MRVLLLWAADGSPNLGVRALGEGHASLVRQVWPQADIVHHNYGSRATPVPMGSVRSASKELLTGRGGVVEWLRSFDLVIDTRSGDSFSDMYGLPRLTVMTQMAEAVRRSGTAMVLGPQTYGPFASRRSVWLAKWALRAADTVMTRDSESAAVLRGLGRPADVVTTDVVFALPKPTEPAVGDYDIAFNVSGLLWRGQAGTDADDYRKVVLGLLESWRARGRHVTLFAHVLEGSANDSDVAVLDEVQDAAGGDLPVVVPRDLAEVRRELAGATVTVGSRMHCCLNSLSVGVPAVPLAYSRKFGPLLADIGWSQTVSLRADDPVGQVLQRTEDETLRQRVGPVLDVAQEKLALARDALKEYGSA